MGSEADYQALVKRYSTGSFSDFSDSTENFAMGDIEFGSSSCLSGADLDSIPVQSLADSIADVKVFYRVAPRHKLSIVRALQKNGDIVAMTGDGKFDRLYTTAMKLFTDTFFRGKRCHCTKRLRYWHCNGPKRHRCGKRSS